MAQLESLGDTNLRNKLRMVHRGKLATASRHLYDNVHGKARERLIVRGFLNRLQLGPTRIYAGERPDFRIYIASGAVKDRGAANFLLRPVTFSS